MRFETVKEDMLKSMQNTERLEAVEQRDKKEKVGYRRK